MPFAMLHLATASIVSTHIHSTRAYKSCGWRLAVLVQSIAENVEQSSEIQQYGLEQL